MKSGSSSSVSTSTTARSPSGRSSHARTGQSVYSRILGMVSCVAVLGMDQHPHVDLVLALFDDDLADAAFIPAERDAELELADISLSEAEGPTGPLGLPVGAGRRPLVSPLLARVHVESTNVFAVVIDPSRPAGEAPRRRCAGLSIMRRRDHDRPSCSARGRGWETVITLFRICRSARQSRSCCALNRRAP